MSKAQVTPRTPGRFVCSYPFVTARFSLSIDELRIIFATVSLVGSVLGGKSISEMIEKQRACSPDGYFKNADEEAAAIEALRKEFAGVRIKGVSMEVNRGGYLYVKAPYSYFVPGNTKHFDRVKTAFDRLSSTFIHIEHDGYWAKCAVVAEPVIRRYSSVEFVIGRNMLWQMLYLAGGFRQLDLGVIMKIRSPYSMRFYTFVAGQKTQTVVSIKKLREMFMAEDSYASDTDFIKWVVEPAKRELDAKSPWSFTYEILHGRGKGAGPIEAIRLTPKKRLNE